jgi:hypothetical protein
MNRKKVLVTYPRDSYRGCIISRAVAVASGKKSVLHLTVGRPEKGNGWMLIVKADKDELFNKRIDKDSAPDGFVDLDIKLESCAGRTVNIQLINQPYGWYYETAYWADINLTVSD